MRFLNRTRGFSLIELMTTVTVAILLLMMAMPSMRQLFIQSQDQMLQDELIKLLQFARRVALLQHKTVGFCQSQDLMQCTTKPANGVIIFTEEENRPQIIYTFRFKQNGQINWRGFPYYIYLQFLATGMTSQENGSFWYVPQDRSLPAWSITVSKAGRPKVVTSTH